MPLHFPRSLIGYLAQKVPGVPSWGIKCGMVRVTKSGYDPANLEVHDVVPIKAQLLEDNSGVFVKLR